MSQSIMELTTLIPSPQYSILYHHHVGGKDYFSLRNKTNLAFYFSFQKLENISINDFVYQTAEELINAFNVEFHAQQYVSENNESGLDNTSQSIIELTTLIPNPQYSILYHHQIDNKDYFSLKSDNNRTSYFSFKKLENISINNVFYQTAEGLINGFNAEFNNAQYVSENIENKQYDLTPDNSGYKYPTVNAVNQGLNLKANLVNPIFIGNPEVPTQVANPIPDYSNRIANTAFVGNLLMNYAKTTSPSFYGIPTAPTAASGNNTNQVATTAFVQTIARPYKVYTALLSQSDTNAPTAVVLENTLGGTVLWSRATGGVYYATLTGAFASNKTAIFVTNRLSNDLLRSYRGDANIVYLESSNGDGNLLNHTIEIRVYN